MGETILSTIQSPADIKTLGPDKLRQLAHEMRQRIIEVMSVTGGHLASGLGAVEITLALHKVFETPHDKLIWDVGHQTYPHKLLTGRNDRFGEIRQYKGLCPFTDPDESPYDHFHAGHAGTALSLALGVAKNRDLTGRGEYVIPIIGDATLTCGLTLEALNNIEKDLGKFIIVLNDNKMSISNNVGAITHILSRMLSNPTLHKMHQEVDGLVSKIPACGDLLSAQGKKLTESLKNLVSPAAFFSHYGLSYIGPVDGHDIDSLVDTFERVKDSKWPVILHTVTQKGKGLEIAENNPITWHGVKPFDVNTCKMYPSKSTKATYPKIFGKQMLKMAEEDPSIVVVTPAMPAGSCLAEMRKKFPDRCLDVGIAEGHAVTYAGGIGYGGRMKVVASVYSTFLQRALDNVFLDICLQETPVVVAIDRAGIAGGDGNTHNGIYDISFLNAMPNMVICQPRNGHILKELLESAHGWERPVAIRYPNIDAEESDAPIKKRQMGKGEILAEGGDLLIVALGHMCDTALEIREQLLSRGVKATVVDPVFAKPLDSDLFHSLMPSFDKVLTIEEHAVTCGLGSIVNNWLMAHGYGDRQVLNCGIPETFVGHGGRGPLLEELELTPSTILKRIDRHFSFEAKAEATSSVS